jgi:hypothetical protein
MIKVGSLLNTVTFDTDKGISLGMRFVIDTGENVCLIKYSSLRRALDMLLAELFRYEVFLTSRNAPWDPRLRSCMAENVRRSMTFRL